MSKHFYRDVQVIKVCRVPTCLVEYRPQKDSFFAKLNLCHKHRNIYYRNWYINRFLPFFSKLSREQQDRYRKMRYETWKKWVEKNKDKRRLQALASYHKNKHKHVARKHRKKVVK